MFSVPSITNRVDDIYNPMCHFPSIRLVRDEVIVGSATQHAHLRNDTTVAVGFLDPFEVWMIRRNARKLLDGGVGEMIVTGGTVDGAVVEGTVMQHQWTSKIFHGTVRD